MPLPDLEFLVVLLCVASQLLLDLEFSCFVVQDLPAAAGFSGVLASLFNIHTQLLFV